MLFTVMLASLILAVSPVNAENNKKLDLEKFQTSISESDIGDLIKALPSSGKGGKDCGRQIQNIKIKDNLENGVLVFVSFSMPKESLIELCNEAEKYNAALVIRGIYQNSFTKTKDKILKISSNGLSLNIDPQLFKQYNIQKVPTFILIRNGKEVSRLTGNASLEFAAKKLKESI